MRCIGPFAFSVVALLASASMLAAEGEPIVPITQVERGATVTVRGVVERITDEDEFWLADESGGIRVYVDADRVPADTGEIVTVDGTVDDDLGPLEIYARTLTRADGSVATFDQE